MSGSLRDDMTLIEAQAEAERRWPGCLFVKFAEDAGGFHQLVLPPRVDQEVDPGEGGDVFNASTPVGCLDQAIADEARREQQRFVEFAGSPQGRNCKTLGTITKRLGSGLYGSSVAGCQGCGATVNCAHIWIDAEGSAPEPIHRDWVNLCAACLLEGATYLRDQTIASKDEK